MRLFLSLRLIPVRVYGSKDESIFKSLDLKCMSVAITIKRIRYLSFLMK